jgi:hypothetical protein
MRSAVVGPALREWAGFLAWLVVGAAYAMSLLAILTIGLFIAPVALVMTVLLWRKRRADRELLGLVSGLALPLLYVAYLNRDGPGTVCTTGRDGSQSCNDEWSSWPWLAVGVLLLLPGAGAFVAAPHAARSPTQSQAAHHE